MTDAVPWVKWYFDKWRGDNGLRACGLAARGLWADMLAIMHGAEPYGHLALKGGGITPRQLASMVGMTNEEDVQILLGELQQNGVYSLTEGGLIYCRRLVRDHEVREKSRSNGRLGGNPVLAKIGLTPSPDLGLTPPLKTEKEKEKEKEREEERKKEPSLRSGKKDTGAKGTRLPPDWRPGDVGWKFAVDLGLNPRAVFAVFRDHWLSQPGLKGIKTDWLATWRNWCREDVKRSGAVPPKVPDLLTPQSRPSFVSTVSNGL